MLCITHVLLCPRNDLYCVGRDVKPYSLTRTAVFVAVFHIVTNGI